MHACMRESKQACDRKTREFNGDQLSKAYSLKKNSVDDPFPKRVEGDQDKKVVMDIRPFCSNDKKKLWNTRLKSQQLNSSVIEYRIN